MVRQRASEISFFIVTFSSFIFLFTKRTQSVWYLNSIQQYTIFDSKVNSFFNRTIAVIPNS